MNENSKPEGIPNVFIVEDDIFLGRMLMDELRSAKAEPKLFLNAEDVLEAMKAIIPAVIILDIFLPSMSGLDALEIMRKDERLKAVPVIVVSNTDDKAHQERAESLGARFLIKAASMPHDIASRAMECVPRAAAVA